MPSNTRAVLLLVCKLGKGRLNLVIFGPYFKLMDEKVCTIYTSRNVINLDSRAVLNSDK